MKKFIAAALAGIALTASALPKDEDIWTFIASNLGTGDRYSIQNKSAEITKNDNGIPVIAVRSRGVDKNGNVTPYRWYVPLNHCDIGQGIVVIMDPHGNYIDKAPFAFGSGTVAGSIAEVMCSVAESMLKEEQSKPSKPRQSGTGPSI